MMLHAARRRELQCARGLPQQQHQACAFRSEPPAAPGPTGGSGACCLAECAAAAEAVWGMKGGCTADGAPLPLAAGTADALSGNSLAEAAARERRAAAAAAARSEGDEQPRYERSFAFPPAAAGGPLPDAPSLGPQLTPQLDVDLFDGETARPPPWDREGGAWAAGGESAVSAASADDDPRESLRSAGDDSRDSPRSAEEGGCRAPASGGGTTEANGELGGAAAGCDGGARFQGRGEEDFLGAVRAWARRGERRGGGGEEGQLPCNQQLRAGSGGGGGAGDGSGSHKPKDAGAVQASRRATGSPDWEPISQKELEGSYLHSEGLMLASRCGWSRLNRLPNCRDWVVNRLPTDTKAQLRVILRFFDIL
jgi:hypothetical protein